MPPLTREHDVGLSTLLVAGRFCRERRAMLIVDPPAQWASSAAALDGMRHWPFRSEDAAMFYPRVVAFDRLRGRFEMFAPCGVAAGMIARCDESWPVWSAAEGDDAILRPGLRPAWNVSNADRSRLINAGINLLQSVRIAPKFAASPRTLASGSAAVSDWRYLSQRRLALFVMTSVERGTRWMRFERNAESTWLLARGQVEAFLESLYAEGAFVGRTRRRKLLRGLRRAHQHRRDPARRQDQPRLRFCRHQARRVPRLPGHAQHDRVAHPVHQPESLRQFLAERRRGDRVVNPARAGAESMIRPARVWRSWCFTSAMPAAAETLEIPEEYRMAVSTASARGIAIFLHDAAAARASDELMERKIFQRDNRLEGWLTDLVMDRNRVVVDFIGTDGGNPAVLYRVQVPVGRWPRSSTRRSSRRSRSANHSRPGGARGARPPKKSASARIFARHQYNSVVISPDPAPDGLIHVYMLAATTESGVIVAGGHYRYDFSPDGKLLEAQRAFTKRCFNIEAPDRRRANRWRSC